MPVLLVRHGHTAFNSENGERIRGWIDLPLTDRGEDAANRTAQALSGYALAHIYSSDLQRAAVTAKYLAQSSGAVLTLHPQLRPWNLGALHGQPTDAANPVIETLVRSPTTRAPGDGESFYEFLLRYLPFVLPLVRNDQTVAVVTHIRNVKALEAHYANGGYGVNLQKWLEPPCVPPGGVALVTPRTFEVLHAPDGD